MSYYSSKSSNYTNNTHSTFSYYNQPTDLYRSYTNLRTPPVPSAAYPLPLYVPPPSFSSLKKPTFMDESYARIAITRVNSSKPSPSVQPSPSTRRYDSSSSLEAARSSSTSNLSSIGRSSNDRSENGSMSSASSFNAVNSSGFNSQSSIVPFKPSDNNDLAATAISNIQLNYTDDLMTQVDYYLNEIDNRMICNGKQIEIEGFDLQSRSGLISRCIYLNELLTEANMNESNLDSDPLFTQNGKAILLFTDKKDAEAFAQKHTAKFSVSYTNKQTPNSPDDSKQKAQKKNVSFIENPNYSVNIASSNDEDDFNQHKSILKSARAASQSPTRSSKPSDPITSRSTIGFNFNESSNQDVANDLLVTANASKKSKLEGYEILTIRAKLKQRVDQTRSKQVTLGDIDSIMRNVVTIIQDEFMKRFPSGPAPSVTSSNSTVVKRN